MALQWDQIESLPKYRKAPVDKQRAVKDIFFGAYQGRDKKIPAADRRAMRRNFVYGPGIPGLESGERNREDRSLVGKFLGMLGVEPTGPTPEQKARAYVEMRSKDTGIPMDEMVGGPKALEQFAGRFTDAYSLGIPGAIHEAMTGEPMVPQPSSSGERIAGGLGELAGYIPGLAGHVTGAAGREIAKRLPQASSLVGRIGAAAAAGAGGLAAGYGVRNVGEALKESTPVNAIESEFRALREGAETGAIFGAAGQIPQRLVRLATGIAALEGQRALSGNAPVNDQRPVSERAFDLAQDIYYLWGYGGPAAMKRMEDRIASYGASGDMGGLGKDIRSEGQKIRERLKDMNPSEREKYFAEQVRKYTGAEKPPKGEAPKAAEKPDAPEPQTELAKDFRQELSTLPKDRPLSSLAERERSLKTTPEMPVAPPETPAEPGTVSGQGIVLPEPETPVTGPARPVENIPPEMQRELAGMTAAPKTEQRAGQTEAFPAPEAPVAAPEVVPEKMTKREKSLAEYRDYVSGLSPEERTAAGELVIENPRMPATRIRQIRKRLADMEAPVTQAEVPAEPVAPVTQETASPVPEMPENVPEVAAGQADITEGNAGSNINTLEGQAEEAPAVVKESFTTEEAAPAPDPVRDLQSVVGKYGWRVRQDGKDIRLINRKGVHAATIRGKDGKYRIFAGDQKVLTGNNRMSDGAEKIVRDFFYGQVQEPENQVMVAESGSPAETAPDAPKEKEPDGASPVEEEAPKADSGELLSTIFDDLDKAYPKYNKASEFRRTKAFLKERGMRERAAGDVATLYTDYKSGNTTRDDAIKMFSRKMNERKAAKDRKKKAGAGTVLYSAIPVDQFGKQVKKLTRLYEKYIGTPLWEFVSEKAPNELGKQHPLFDEANRLFIYDYKKPEEFRELRDQTKLKIHQMTKSAKKLADLMAKYPRAEQIRLSQIIRGGITANEKRYESAFTAAKEFRKLEKDLTELGLLGPDNRFRRLNRKEIAAKFREVRDLDQKIRRLADDLNPKTRREQKVVEDIVRDVSEEISGETSGNWNTRSGKAFEVNEKRVMDALTARGFAEGEARTMLDRIKNSVVAADLPESGGKETRKIIRETIRKTVRTEIRETKGYSDRVIRRASATIKKDIRRLEEKRADILKRIQTHYKNSGKLYLRKAYEKIEAEKGYLQKIGDFIQGRNARLKRGYSIRRQDLDRHYAKEVLGEIEQAPYLVYKGLSEEYHDLEMMRMFDRIDRNDDWAIAPGEWQRIMDSGTSADIEKYRNFKPLPKSDRLGRLSGKMVDRYIWDDLNQAVEARSAFIKSWDRMLRWWKSGHTIFNPATHGRNFMSNVAFVSMAGLSPHRVDVYAEAARTLLNRKNRYWKEIDENTMLLEDSFLSNEGIKFLEGLSDLKNRDSLFEKSADVMKKLADKPGEIYQFNEKYFKTALYIYGRKEGMSVRDAAEFAQKWLFDYSRIPPAIRWAKRWYAPFITWSYLAFPRFAETAIRKPWIYAGALLLYKALEEWFRQMSGESKEEMEMEKRFLPEYMRKSILPGAISHLRLGYKDEYGRSKYLDLTYPTPWGSLADQWGQSRLAFSPFLPNNPIWTMVGEVAFNETLFTGQPLTGPIDDTNDYLKKIGMEIWRQAMPSLAPGGYSADKLMSAWYGEKDWAGRDRSLGEAVFDVLLGIKIRSIDFGEQRDRRSKEIQQERKDLRKEFSRQYQKIAFLSPKTGDSEKEQKIMELYEKTVKKLDKINAHEEWLYTGKTQDAPWKEWKTAQEIRERH